MPAEKTIQLGILSGNAACNYCVFVASSCEGRTCATPKHDRDAPFVCTFLRVMGLFSSFFWVSVCGWGRRRKRGTLYVLRAERSQDLVLTQGLGGDADRRTGSPSISIITKHQKIPVSFHTAHPSISIQKFCHPSNSIQESLLFPYKVERAVSLKTITSAYQKHVLVSQKSS